MTGVGDGVRWMTTVVLSGTARICTVRHLCGRGPTWALTFTAPGVE